MTDKELIQELRSKAEVEGAGSTRRLLELAARALEQVQWISVKDMYPRKGQTVIALLSYTRTHIEYELAEFNGKYFDADDAYLPSQLVTHWMPLPEPPNEVESKPVGRKYVATKCGEFVYESRKEQTDEPTD